MSTGHLDGRHARVSRYPVICTHTPSSVHTHTHTRHLYTHALSLRLHSEHVGLHSVTYSISGSIFTISVGFDHVEETHNDEESKILVDKKNTFFFLISILLYWHSCDIE